MLDIKKVYIDTRFKTADSLSDCDFFIELPRSLNVPDNTICYITDIVIPVSWHTVDARNNKLYMMSNWLGIPKYQFTYISEENCKHNSYSVNSILKPCKNFFLNFHIVL